MARLEWAINLALHADRAIPSDRSILGTCDPALTLDPLNSKPPDTDQTLPHVVLPLNGNQLIAIEPVYNLAVKYTDGYGIVAFPVNEMVERGNLLLWAHDIPVKAKGDLAVAYGAIHYGALTRDPPRKNSTFRRSSQC